jgi:hypothetical protein
VRVACRGLRRWLEEQLVDGSVVELSAIRQFLEAAPRAGRLEHGWIHRDPQILRTREAAHA